MILEALCKLQGVPTVKPHRGTVKKPSSDAQKNPTKAQDVLQVQWMWSHDRIAQGDTFKLAFLPILAPGFHVYAPQEKRMTPFKVELVLPAGISLAQPILYPKPDRKHDPFLKVDVFQYEKDVPISALLLHADEGLALGEIVVKAAVSYQACNDVLCYPPTTKILDIPIQAISDETKRNQVSGWKKW